MLYSLDCIHAEIKETRTMIEQADIGIAGLAAMGANLGLNFASKGYSLAIYNRTREKLDSFMERAGGENCIFPTNSIPEFAGFLKRPRKILLMVRAGQPVDEMIGRIRPHLQPGDILIDGANSSFRDTIRREAELKKDGILFVGMGISGGEEGALRGPSLMAGGSSEAWAQIKEPLTAIAAKAGNPPTVCCAHVGTSGAGHFVKMIHNGIEYADMQMIAEVYAFMKEILRMTPEEMSDVFSNWCKTEELNSYLVSITADILRGKDPSSGKYLVDVILDTAGQKGTGKWTSEAAFELGIPAPTLVEAVCARIISSLKEERMDTYSGLPGVMPDRSARREEYLGKLKNALISAKICAYAQGFSLMAAASREFGWNLEAARIAEIWRGGCIIRTSFLDEIAETFRDDPQIENLMLAPYFKDKIAVANCDWREVVSKAVRSGVAVPALSSSLAYFDSYRTARLPANIIQALRDFFGGHVFEFAEPSREETFQGKRNGFSDDISSADFNV